MKLLFVLSLFSVAFVLAQTAPESVDPFADPANDVYNPLRYIPKDSLTSVGVGELAFLLQQWVH